MTPITALKKVLVTGGNKGIGLAVCLALLKDHPDVYVLLGSRNAARGAAAVQQLTDQLGANVTNDRLQVLALDTTDAASIKAAAASFNGPLFGLVNNAGRGHGLPKQETLETNYWGVRHVTDAFLSKLQPAGRIVNVCSASGPIYVASLPAESSTLKQLLSEPWKLKDVAALDELATTTVVLEQSDNSWDSYGLSKSLLAAYSHVTARENPGMKVNGVTPGFIDTDLTAGMGASGTPADGAVPILHCLFSVDDKPQGRFYGSDCKRSPLNVYRGPGDAEYEGPDGP